MQVVEELRGHGGMLSHPTAVQQQEAVPTPGLEAQREQVLFPKPGDPSGRRCNHKGDMATTRVY